MQDHKLPLDLVVAIWKLGQSELNREENKNSSSSERLMIVRVAQLAKEWVREVRNQANVEIKEYHKKSSSSIQAVSGTFSKESEVRPGEYHFINKKSGG